MITVHPEFVVDSDAKKKKVLLPYAEWQRVVLALEELEDIKAYDKAKAGKNKVMPFEDAV